MDLLDFARGPALQVALVLFAFGVFWRLASLLLLPRVKDLSKPRAGAPPALFAALREIVRRAWPQRPFPGATLFWTINSYIFHLGLAIVVFAFAPHILFIRSLLGLSWPSLPSNLINAVGVVTVASLLAALGRRLTHPVLRLLSTADDYFAWIVTVLPVITGLAATSHLGARYETLLAVHILSVALLLAWLPYGKLMHPFFVFITRGFTGVYLSRRGAEL